MSLSEDKFDVITEPMRFADGTAKKWVRVLFKRGQSQWVPSFEDLFRIIAPIAQIEDEKYPESYHRGRQMLVDFVRLAIKPDITWEEIRSGMKIPIRDPSRLIESQQTKRVSCIHRQEFIDNGVCWICSHTSEEFLVRK